jgi:hypothetical protein
MWKDGEQYVADRAMEYAARGEIPNAFQATVMLEEARAFGHSLSPWEVLRFPIIAESLLDADRYGHRGAFV